MTKSIFKFPFDTELLFSIFKYSIYLCLCINGAQFIFDDIRAAAHTLNGDSSLFDKLKIYAVSVDTLAWIVLLAVYELETYVVDDDRLNGGLKWLFYAISVLCYVAILYAFAGYVGKLVMLTDIVPLAGDFCNWGDRSLTLMTKLDSYEPVNAQTCAALSNSTIYQLRDEPIIIQMESFRGFDGILALAWVDVINSATWVLVVVFIQLDIVLQLRGELNTWILRITAAIKAVLYLALFVVAVYWGVYGALIDFWDACLWLLGFVFIELNIFSWNREMRTATSGLQI